MLHRRVINNAGESNDGKYNLTLNDTSVVRPKLWLLLGDKTHSSQLQHEAWLQLESPPHMIAINVSNNGAGFKKTFPEETGIWVIILLTRHAYFIS